MHEFTEYHINILENDKTPGATIPDWLTLQATARVQPFHRSMRQYKETPLLALNQLAAQGGVAGVFVKNEAERFGLNAFKALGSSYAIAQTICEKLGLNLAEVGMPGLQRPEVAERFKDMVFATCTDGNHGRGVAWTARELGCKAFIYMPAGTEPERVQAIEKLGATVTVTDMCYDDTVALAAKTAAENGWTLVQDTSFPDYEDIPKLIIQGYSTIAAEEAAELRRLGVEPTHIFLQAGVGSMAGGMLAALKQEFPQAKFIILEPVDVACCYLAAKEKNDSAAVSGIQKTIMAGLNCGTPCPLIMPVLREMGDFFMGCPDFVAAHGMRLAANPLDGDPKFISGESGAISLGTAALLLSDKLTKTRRAMQIDENSVLLCLNTEGSMAPTVWQRIVEGGEIPLPEK
jgi:diaminopropionate ammonia-lyase